MFERYTEKARRTIFFARYEASQYGSPYIETEHLLLGVLRESNVLAKLVIGSQSNIEAVRKAIEARIVQGTPIPTSVDMPLSNECKRVLAYAFEEAERFGHQQVGTEHVLLGLLREKSSKAAAVLNELGVTLERTRDEIAATPPDTFDPGGQPAEVQPPGWAGRWFGSDGGAAAVLRSAIEFRVGEKVIGGAPQGQQIPRIGERVVITRAGDPKQSEVYQVADVTFEYAEWGGAPPSIPLKLRKIVVRLEPADSSDPDVQ